MTNRPLEFLQETDAHGRTRIYVKDGWPDEAIVSAGFLEHARRPSVVLEGDWLRITVDNGDAVYKLWPLEPGTANHKITKVRSSLVVR